MRDVNQRVPRPRRAVRAIVPPLNYFVGLLFDAFEANDDLLRAVVGAVLLGLSSTTHDGVTIISLIMAALFYDCATTGVLLLIFF
jgi:hypothetical protein